MIKLVDSIKKANSDFWEKKPLAEMMVDFNDTTEKGQATRMHFAFSFLMIVIVIAFLVVIL